MHKSRENIDSQQRAMREELLHDFLIFLNKEELITDYDFEYEEAINEFLNKRK